MLTDSALRELLDYPSTAPVLSVYLNLDVTGGSADTYKLQLRNLLKDANLPEDETAVIKYFEHEREWTGRSLAMFSCAAQDYFRAFPLAVPIRSRVRVSNQPYVKPLADVLDAYGGYGVVLVDKQGARLFLFHLGELREQEGIMGQEVRHTKRGGASSMPGRRGGTAGQSRGTEETVDRNIKDAVDFATSFFEDNHVRRILIGGTDANVAQFRSELPKSWQSLVVGSFPISMTAKHTEVLEKAMEVGMQAEHQRETQLVEKMITSAAKGKGGVVRLDDTLGMVREGRIQTLIVQEGYRQPGYRCQGCEYLTTQKLPVCQFCGASFEQIPDAVELAVRRVMQDGGDVEIVRENPELEPVGIGGMLRY
jgi:peptide chain release factor subunit 1